MDDEQYMQLALAEASRAGSVGEVPVGAVVVVGGVVVGRGANARELGGDPTAHAEISAIREAATVVGNWRVGGSLYVTQEPCPMCAGAIVNARIDRLIYGCDNPKAGSVRTLYRLVEDSRLNHRVEVVRGVLATECGALLTSFFKSLRQK